MKNPLGNMGNLLKQAQAMQAQMAKVQEQAASKTVTGTAGGGSVTVTANGALQLVGIVIDPEVVKSGDVEMVQDLVMAASNDALRKAREMMADEMKSVTGGMNVPGLTLAGCWKNYVGTFADLRRPERLGRVRMIHSRLFAQKGCPARPQRVKGRGVPSGHYVDCSRSEAIECSLCRDSFSADPLAGLSRHGG